MNVCDDRPLYLVPRFGVPISDGSHAAQFGASLLRVTSRRDVCRAVAGVFAWQGPILVPIQSAQSFANWGAKQVLRILPQFDEPSNGEE